jgi:hypothetical protein
VFSAWPGDSSPQIPEMIADTENTRPGAVSKSARRARSCGPDTSSRREPARTSSGPSTPNVTAASVTDLRVLVKGLLMATPIRAFCRPR